jgi:hypothetical protein
MKGRHCSLLLIVLIGILLLLNMLVSLYVIDIDNQFSTRVERSRFASMTNWPLVTAIAGTETAHATR